MPENLRKYFEELVSLYEAQKQRAEQLEADYGKAQAKIQEQKQQIDELKRTVESLSLAAAFGNASQSEASSKDRERSRKLIDSLIGEIDRCIELLEN